MLYMAGISSWPGQNCALQTYFPYHAAGMPAPLVSGGYNPPLDSLAEVTPRSEVWGWTLSAPAESPFYASHIEFRGRLIIEGSQRLPWNQRVEARPSNAATRGGIASSRRAVQLLTGKGARAGLWLRKHRKNLVEVATSDAVGRPEFWRDAPGQHRATDITEHSFEEVKVQGWVVLDVHSG